MVKFLLFAVLMLAPWRPGHWLEVMAVEIVWEPGPCGAVGWVNSGQAIHLCRAIAEPCWGRVVLHESQHLMARRYLPVKNWDLFSHVARKALRSGDYTEEQRAMAEYLLAHGPEELHAQLPWITEGKIPPQLQRWYPWLALGR